MMWPFKKNKDEPVLPDMVPLKMQAKDLEISRLVDQAETLTTELENTVRELSANLRKIGNAIDDRS